MSKFFLINALDLRGGAARAPFRFYKWLGGIRIYITLKIIITGERK